MSEAKLLTAATIECDAHRETAAEGWESRELGPREGPAGSGD